MANITGPLYALTQRESVETEGGLPLAMESGFLLTGPVHDEHGQRTNEMGLLLFTSPESAENCRSKLQREDCVAVTFRGSKDLRTHAQYFADLGYRWVIFDRHGGQRNERISDIDTLINALR